MNNVALRAKQTKSFTCFNPGSSKKIKIKNREVYENRTKVVK